MSTDTYSIQVAVDSTSAVTATRNLTAMEQATGRSERALSGLGNMAKIAGAALLGIGFKTVISEMASFETQMIKLKSLTDATTQQMKAMEKQARELGATTAFSAQQAAEAQGVLASAGLKTNEILAATPKVLELAAAGSLELSKAAEISTGTMKALGLELSDLGRINDVFAKAAGDSSTSVKEIGDAMGQIAPVAKTFKIGLETLSASLGILADNQIKGSEAGNNLKAMLVALSNDTKDNIEILKKHGVTYSQLNVEVYGLAKVMKVLQNAHLSGAESLKIFGSDAAAAGNILAANSTKIDEYAKKLENADGSAKKMADTLNQGLAKAIDSFKGTLSEAALQLGDSGLKGALTDVIQQATGVIAIYEGMGDKFAESNNYTKEQYDNLKSVADELKIVAGAAGGIATLTGAIWAANAAMLAFNIATRANPLIMGATVVAAAAGATFAKIADNQSTIDKQIETAEKRIAAMEKYGLPNLIGTAVGFDTEKERTKLTALKQFKEEQLAATKATIDATSKTEKHTEAAKTNTAATADSTDKTKTASEAKKESAQASKDLAEAERYFNEQLNAQVALAENAGKLFAAQQQTKLVGIEAEKQSIIDKASIEYEHAVSYEEKSRILNESQSATNLLLAKEKEIRDAMTNQSSETIDAKIAAAQSELDNAGQYNLTLAEQLRLKTEIAGLQTDKAILGETSTQSDIKAKSDAEQKANDDRLAAIKAIDDAQTAANTASTAQMAILTANLDAAKEAATGLADAFGSVGGAVGGLGVALASYEKSQAAITDGLQNQLFEIQKLNDGKGDQAKADKATSTASQKQSQLQIKSYGDMAASAQGFFKKGTAGYNALGVATKVFRAFEMAQSAMSMVRMITDNAKMVGAFISGIFQSTAANQASVLPNAVADGAKATASGTAAVAAASAAPFPIGFATGAAMLAFMLAIGVAMAGSGSSAPQMTGADYQKQQSEKYNETVGGTVLGSGEASKSIVNALDIISANSTADLDYSKGMAESLQKLTYSIDNVTGSVAQQMDFGKGNANLAGSSKTTGVFGSAGGGIGGFGIGVAINQVLPFLGFVLSAFTTVTKITKQFAGSGFQFMNELYSNVVKNSTTSVEKYVQILVTETKSSFFGLSKSSKQWITTAYKPIEERVKEAFTDTILGIGNSIIKTADLLGKNTAYLTDQVNNFNIELGRIPMERTDYKGKGSLQRNTENAQINSDRLSAAFQKLSDQMAMLSPQFLESQRIQEGYYETLIRVSVAIATADSKLRAMGIASLVEYSDIADKRGDIEKQMIVQSLQLASSYTDVNDILGKLPGTADDIIDAFNGLNNIKFGLAAIGASSVMLTQDMINVAGGISSLDNTLTSYIDNYLSKTEQSAYHTGLLTDKFTQLGLILPTMGANADDAKSSFRSLLDTLAKDTTNAGRNIYIRVLGMESEFADAATESADLLTSTLNTATTELNNAYKALITMRDKFAGIATSLQSYLGELNNTASDYDNAKALFLKTSELAKNGNEKALQDMTAVSKSFLTASKTRSDDATKAIQQTVSTAKTALQNAYKSLVTLRDKFKGLSQSLRDYKTEITGAGTQQGSPESVYQSTKKAFEDANILAASGNAQGIADLPNAAKSFLDASLKYNATGAMYQTDYQSVLSALDKAIGASDSQVDILNKQLTAAENADKSLASIDGTILSIDEAIKQYQSALKDQSAIDTTQYDLDKELVKENVQAAYDQTVTQIILMNSQLTAAETANIKLEDLKTKTDTVSSSILTMSGAISGYVATQVAKAQADAKAAVHTPTNQPVIDTAAQVGKTNLTTAQAAADALPIKMDNAETNKVYKNETYIKTAKWLIETGARPSDFANVLFYDYGSTEQKQLMPNIPAYANGGMASGLSLVGEKGAELVNFNSPANVTSHSQTTGLFDSIGEAMNDQNIILEDQVTELKALVNLQSNANMVLINEMKGMREELITISRKAKLEAAA